MLNLNPTPSSEQYGMSSFQASADSQHLGINNGLEMLSFDLMYIQGLAKQKAAMSLKVAAPV